MQIVFLTVDLIKKFESHWLPYDTQLSNFSL
jgi:hypothetical protein